MSESCSGSRGKGRDDKLAKWLTLRNAFRSAIAASKLGDAQQSGGGSEKYTTGEGHPLARFEGFVLFARHEEGLPLASDPAPAPAASSASVPGSSPGLAPAPASTVEAGGGRLALATYELPRGIKVMTREPSSHRGARRARVTLEQLFAHRVHGVDNTGNIRVWPAEQVLLHLLLSGPLDSSMAGSRVLELGAGMSGLAGLGVAACSDAVEVVITDGNPDALMNLEACVNLNAKAGVFGNTKVCARRLVWDSLDRNGDRAALLHGSLAGGSGFDLIVASDCLFFKDFHTDLISTIANLLKPGGRAVLVQPQRGGTTNLFMQRMAEAAAVEAAEVPTEKSARVTGGGGGDGIGRLAARLLDRYDDQIWKMHQDYLQMSRKDGDADSNASSGGGDDSVSSPLSSSSATTQAPAYLPDEHQPLLLEVVRRPVGGSATKKAADIGWARTAVAPIECESTNEEQPSWVSWPGCLSSRVAFANVKEDAIDMREGDGGDEGSGGSGDGSGRSRVQEEWLVSPLPQPVELDLSLLPSPPPSVAAVELHQQQQRPDRRMIDVYDTLAERLRVNIRERRRKAAAESTLVGVTVVQEKAGVGAGGEDDGGAAVGGQQQLWVAVAGAPGSGKTTLATEVCKRVQSEEISAVCLPMDGYHFYRRELDLLPDPHEAHRRRGAHWTFDGRRFLRELRDARRTGGGRFPGFDHARGDPVENQWQVEQSHAVVIVEGNYLLLKGVDPWDEASGLFDEAWAIRCPPEVCGERVQKRHMQTGLGEEEARVRVEGNDLPNARLVSERCPWGEVDVIIDSL